MLDPGYAVCLWAGDSRIYVYRDGHLYRLTRDHSADNGGRHGGGVEWTAPDGLVGITAIELDADGLITRMTSLYDGRQLPTQRKTALLSASFAS